MRRRASCATSRATVASGRCACPAAPGRSRGSSRKRMWRRYGRKRSCCTRKGRSSTWKARMLRSPWRNRRTPWKRMSARGWCGSTLTPCSRRSGRRCPCSNGGATSVIPTSASAGKTARYSVCMPATWRYGASASAGTAPP